MFVSDKIVFLELQKTGCTHIRNLLMEIVGGKFVERHIQAHPSLFTDGRFFLGSVRDPWEWHVSLWAYCCDGRGDLFGNVTTSGVRLRDRGWRRHPFSIFIDVLNSRPNRHAEEWKRTLHDVNDPGAFRQWLYLLHDEEYSPDVGDRYWQFPLKRFAGLLTYRYLRVFTCRKGELGSLQAISTSDQLKEHDSRNGFIDYFIRNERLEADLLDALRLANIEVPQQRAADMASRPRTNASSRKKGSRFYYDAATEKLVGERDRFIIEKFGYSAPSSTE
jgi:hypothetical protein